MKWEKKEECNNGRYFDVVAHGTWYWCACAYRRNLPNVPIHLIHIPFSSFVFQTVKCKCTLSTLIISLLLFFIFFLLNSKSRLRFALCSNHIGRSPSKFSCSDRQQATNYSSSERARSFSPHAHTVTLSVCSRDATPIFINCKLFFQIIIAVHRFSSFLLFSVLTSSSSRVRIRRCIQMTSSVSQSLFSTLNCLNCLFFRIKIFNRFVFLTTHIFSLVLEIGFFVSVCSLWVVNFIGHQTTQHICRHIDFVMIFRHLHFHRKRKAQTTILRKPATEIARFLLPIKFAF